MTRQPTHPGKLIRDDYLMPLELTVTALAAALHVSRKTLSKIINEKGTVTPDMALRLSCAFDTSPDFWMNLQKNYDLWQAEHLSTSWQEVRPLAIRQLRAA
jgi:addiction module HigA family antidote